MNPNKKAIRAGFSVGLSFTTRLLAGLLLAVGCHPAQTSRPDSTEDEPFALPVLSAAPEDCAASEAAVRSGLALQDDFYRALTCVLDRLPEDKVDGFLSSAGKVQFKERATACLPDEITARLPPDLGNDIVRIYANAEGLKRLDKKVCEHLGAGTWRGTGLSLGGGTRGHSDATRAAALQVRGTIPISDAALNVLTDAAQDADFFQWTNMAAHAQTPDDHGIPGDVAQAQAATVEWVRDAMRRADELCRTPGGDGARRGLYFLGYAMHAVEDLAAHRGRTNPEHCFNSTKEKLNPDENPASYGLAVEMAASFLSHALEGPLKSCRDRIGGYSGGQVWYSEKTGTLGLKRDLNVSTGREYEGAWKLFDSVKDKPGVRVRWFGDVASGPTHCADAPVCAQLLQHMYSLP